MNIALVCTADNVDFAEITSVSAALQKQITTDFEPRWSLDADVNPFARIEDVPADHAVIQLVGQLSDPDLEGYHYFDDRNEPHALVRVDVDNWALYASHECLEMLADPGGSMLESGPPLGASIGAVSYLREICDPCQNISYGYVIDGLPMSDFYNPNYFDATKTPGATYCATGSIAGPREILPGGYLCYRDETGVWRKAANNGGQLVTTVLPAGLLSGTGSLREKIDSHSRRNGLADVFQNLGEGHAPRLSALMDKVALHKKGFSEFGKRRAKRFDDFVNGRRTRRHKAKIVRTGAPSIAKVNLNSVSANRRDTVIVSGFGFGAAQSGSAINLDDAATGIQAIEWKDTEITFTIAGAGVVPGQRRVSLTVSGQQSNSVPLMITA